MVTILVVEDDPDILEMLRWVLALEGYQVLTAAGGLPAVTVLHQQRVDLILSDLSMPDLDGAQLYHSVRADPRSRTLPFVLMSGIMGVHPLPTDAHSTFLPKPFDLDRLLMLIAAMLAHQAPAPE